MAKKPDECFGVTISDHNFHHKTIKGNEKHQGRKRHWVKSDKHYWSDCSERCFNDGGLMTYHSVGLRLDELEGHE